MRTKLQELRGKEPPRVRLTVDKVALRTRKLANVVARPEVRARLDKLACLGADEFDVAHLDLLDDLGWAADFIHIQGLVAKAAKGGPQVPEETLEEAKEVKDRMLKCATYYLEDHPTAAKKLASIRQGTGYRDLASDLARLAGLYRAYQATLSADTKHYRADDARRARRLYEEIVDALTAVPAVDARDAARIKHLCRQSYDEVWAAAHFIFRREPELRALFPTIYTDKS